MLGTVNKKLSNFLADFVCWGGRGQDNSAKNWQFLDEILLFQIVLTTS